MGTESQTRRSTEPETPEALRAKYLAERDKRLRASGNEQYVEVDGELFGPMGQGTATVRKLSMARADLLENFQPADLAQDPELSKVIAMAEAQSVTPQLQE